MHLDTSRVRKSILRKKYAEACPKYSKLAKKLKKTIKTSHSNEEINILGCFSRIKKFESFWDKMIRRGYTDPFQQTDDICGLRVICYYPSDLKPISEIINREFEVKESVDKTDLLEPNQFGYRSLHFVVSVRADRLRTLDYLGLEGLRAEIQLRTVLMHSWAEISHKLAYKKQEHVPDKFKRELSSISALLETADQHFDSLRKERKEYVKLMSKEALSTGKFNLGQEMNLDSLQAFLDFYFPNRGRQTKETSLLLDEIIECNVTIRDLVLGYDRTKDSLPQIEMNECSGKTGRMTQVGIASRILDLTHNRYWQSHRKLIPESYLNAIEKLRAKFPEST